MKWLDFRQSNDEIGKIIEKRVQLIDSLERRSEQQTETETFFTIRWAVT